MTLRELVNETVDPKTVQDQLTQLVSGITGLQKNTQLNAQKMTDSETVQKLGLEAKKLLDMSNGLNNTFQELVKQNIAMQQQQKQQTAQPAGNQQTANGAAAPVPTATQSI